MASRELIQKEFPLHWFVWNNDCNELRQQLSTNQLEKEKLDCRGRTPLMLAVTLGHIESVRVLLDFDCNVLAENRENWTSLQEAVSTGDPELVQILLEHRDKQRHSHRVGGIPLLLQKLKEAPDFYVEMKWEFTSWVPLVSRMCPSDSYKVYKQGSNVRIDTTLLGFDQTNWQRGNKSYIFKGSTTNPPEILHCNRSYIFSLNATGENAVMMEVDHESKEVYTEEMQMLPNEVFPYSCNADAVSSRLTSPIVTTYVDTEKINFERNKAGIWGWRSDKEEPINGYGCKVFSATNVELVTKTRTEHLPEADRERAKAPRTALQSFLGIAETEHRATTPEPEDHADSFQKNNPTNITAEEYFDPSVVLQGRDIGRPKEVLSKVQKFRATLWLCEDYPLTLQEQIMPIVDLMAISSPHFAKLKDFIQMQLPAGFPVKIEIPLFHVLHARITFGNIFGLDSGVSGITRLDDNGKLSCFVSDSCFEAPAHYTRLGPDSRQFNLEDEDGLMQFAIQQSLVEAGSEGDEVDIWEALRAQRPLTPSMGEDRELQRAIQASLRLSLGERTSPDGSTSVTPDEDLLAAIVGSKEQLAKEERKRSDDEERRRIEEEELMAKVLQLSLIEK